uniref:Uncharacterized protein n=1 Tax=Zea mays TaxID=4577 RepID=A0A804QDJ0_MAIZE
MRISKSAPDLLKKAVTSVKSKTVALRTKLIILASMRRRLAMVGAISRQIHELVASDSREKPVRVEHRSKALTMPKAMTKGEDDSADGYCHRDEEDDDDDDHDDLDILDTPEEPSVIDIIRSKREVEGLEFNMDHDIDEACDMFIRRFRSRMNMNRSL